ncbi:MAG: SRPBCC family protein [Ktedonobacteraceae bacterium]|nr:SRPBCC family protein [Ktedonobacteraceae bacterium]
MSQATTSHVYEIFIRSTPERIWQALTDGDLTQKYYFGCRVESDWKVGSTCNYYGPKGTIDLEGKIVEIEPQQRLVTTFEPKWFPPSEEKPSILTWEIQPMQVVSQVKLTHAEIDDASFEAGQLHMGWLYCLSSLKSLLETGEGLPDIFAS